MYLVYLRKYGEEVKSKKSINILNNWENYQYTYRKWKNVPNNNFTYKICVLIILFYFKMKEL